VLTLTKYNVTYQHFTLFLVTRCELPGFYLPRACLLKWLAVSRSVYLWLLLKLNL